MTEFTLSQRLTLLLDESPLKSIQRWLWVLSTGGTLLDGFVIFALGVAMPLIIAEFHIRPEVVWPYRSGPGARRCFRGRIWRAGGRSSWPKAADARRHDDYWRWCRD